MANIEDGQFLQALTRPLKSAGRKVAGIFGYSEREVGPPESSNGERCIDWFMVEKEDDTRMAIHYARDREAFADYEEYPYPRNAVNDHDNTLPVMGHGTVRVPINVISGGFRQERSLVLRNVLHIPGARANCFNRYLIEEPFAFSFSAGLRIARSPYVPEGSVYAPAMFYLRDINGLWRLQVPADLADHERPSNLIQGTHESDLRMYLLEDWIIPPHCSPPSGKSAGLRKMDILIGKGKRKVANAKVHMKSFMRKVIPTSGGNEDSEEHHGESVPPDSQELNDTSSDDGDETVEIEYNSISYAWKNFPQPGSMEPIEGEWLMINCGNSNPAIHYARSRRAFGADYKACGGHVVTTSGERFAIMGRGTVELAVIVGNNPTKTALLELEDVLHIPGVPFNVFNTSLLPNLQFHKTSKIRHRTLVASASLCPHPEMWRAQKVNRQWRLITSMSPSGIRYMHTATKKLAKDDIRLKLYLPGLRDFLPEMPRGKSYPIPFPSLSPLDSREEPVSPITAAFVPEGPTEPFPVIIEPAEADPVAEPASEIPAEATLSCPIPSTNAVNIPNVVNGRSITGTKGSSTNIANLPSITASNGTQTPTDSEPLKEQVNKLVHGFRSKIPIKKERPIEASFPTPEGSPQIPIMDNISPLNVDLGNPENDSGTRERAWSFNSSRDTLGRREEEGE